MVRLRDLLDERLLEQMVTEGYVRERRHPDLPLNILNYTERAQFDRVWNPVTRQCRGLIYNTQSGEVVARPFPKFFNYGEEDVSDSYYDSPVTVTDKLDGSLGILYQEWAGGPFAIATRGSFTSDQALHATEVLRREYPMHAPQPGFTYLFEIIYPENRIVVDYKDRDDLVLLGAVNMENGWSTGPHEWLNWPGPHAEVLPYRTFREAIAARPRKNAEGMVVHFVSMDKRLKLKQPDYVELHRLVTGLNERRVWENMKAGRTLDEILEPLPEEFHPWVRKVYDDLEGDWYNIWNTQQTRYYSIIRHLPEGFTRKDFALRAVKYSESALLFLVHDNRTDALAEKIWDLLKPEAGRSPWNRGEDVA